ncbi:MAG: glycoside hydrolase family 3 C-terminal domain-containing protein [Elusimicrobia bacterium]|nr:glycoside hydrolase family 3 C-terminal domain-containing protein [Elusimicrobiota bacterium]
MLRIAAVLLLAVLPCAAALPSYEVESRVEALLGKMTLEEKLGQLQQLDGEANGEFRPEHLELARKGLLGSTLNVRGAKRVNELQRAALESRLKIPILFAFDVIHGYRTVFPIPMGEAASWDPAAVERAAAVAAREAAAAGVKWTFAPMLDIARDPRWGRVAEGSGEDPYLGSAMGAARVRGFQGSDPSAPDKVLATAKHWAGYGAAEGGRDYNTTELSESTLRDVIFPPFRAALDAGAATVMTAFNDLNGVPASANPFLLTQVLRREWGFDGAVVSDYTAIPELINHGFAADGAEAAKKALSAGVDMEMVSRLYARNSAGLPPAAVDAAVRRVLRAKLRAGIFEKPFADEAAEAAALLTPAHRAAAREMARRSMVLLKNDGGVLPLKKEGTLMVLGPLALSRLDQLGSWTGDGRMEDAVSMLDGIRAAAPELDVVFSEKGPVRPDADAVLLFLGEAAAMSGEAAARASLALPGRQLELARKAAASGLPVVVVLMNGRPLSIPRLAETVPAILEAWYPGTEGGPALADVLFGDAAPGGKLPIGFPRSVGQVPLYYAHKNTGRPSDPANKYTSKYLDQDDQPLFPFGFGLTYTTFTLSGLRLDASTVAVDGTLGVSVELANVGRRAGDETVQLYVRDLAAGVTRPVRELKGFERVTLAPGQRRRVSFTLGPQELGFHDAGGRFVVEPGAFKLWAATSSVGGLEADFSVAPRGFKLGPADEAFLEDLGRRAFRFFEEHSDPATGLVRDRARADGSAHDEGHRHAASAAATGFGLSALCAASARGWLPSAEAAARARRTVEFLATKAPREHGWFYHWMDARDGSRIWNSEVSSIDTALLLAGVLSARQCFAFDRELVRLATELYAAVDFPWMRGGHPALLSHGWTPEKGFLPHRWDDYSEGPLLYALALAAPRHPLPPESWRAWRRTTTSYGGYRFLHAGAPLFTHQYPQAWLDLRGRHDGGPSGVDYFANSTLATRAHRRFCLDLAKEFPGYGPDIWGVTASDGPKGYLAWGGPPRHPELDGSVVPCAAAGSLAHTPDISLPALKAMKARHPKAWGRYGFADAFNPRTGWVARDVIGIDVGITLLAAENLRSQSSWRWFMANPELPWALDAAGLR